MEAGAPQGQKKRSRVLAIDDDKDFLELLRYRFEKENCEFITANDGEAGLEKAKAILPDLIMVDIKMPRMDGYLFVRELKHDDKTKTIPVIVLTSYEPMRDLFNVEGIQDYVVKSSDLSSLWKTISKHLPK